MKSNTTQYSELVRIAVEKGEYPRYVYKYHRIDENTERMFVESYLWFSNPQNFNDPFDCQIVIDTSNTAYEIEQWLGKANPTGNPQQHKHTAQFLAERPDQLNSLINETISREILLSGVCCFAKCPDDVLMWAHYGQSHLGYCLKFDILQDTQFFGTILPVKYQDDYPIINYIRERETFIVKTLLTKAKFWEYEQEFRVLGHRKQGKVNINRSALVEVIFGCKCLESNIKNIKNYITQNKYNPVKFKKATVSQTEYKLNIIDL